MKIFLGIVIIMAVVICLYVGWVFFSFFESVPTYLSRISEDLRERNKIEKEKLEIMKKNNSNISQDA